MQHALEEIRRQIDEIRDICGPFELKLTDLEQQNAETRASLKRAQSASSPHRFTLDDLEREAMDLLEKLTQIEHALKIPPGPVRKSP